MDHARGTKDLMKAGVDIYCTQGTAEALSLSGHRLNIIKDREQFKAGHWAVLPFKTIHDAAEPVGFILANKEGEKVMFATDTAYIPVRVNGLTHLIIECNHGKEELWNSIVSRDVDPDLGKRILKNHMSLETLCTMLEANDTSKLKEVYLIHLSDYNSDAERFRAEVQKRTRAVVHV